MSKIISDHRTFVARELAREAFQNFKRGGNIEEVVALKADATELIDDYLDKLPKGLVRPLPKEEMDDFIKSASKLDVSPGKLQKFKLFNEDAWEGRALATRHKNVRYVVAELLSKLPEGEVDPWSKDKMSNFIKSARELGAADLSKLHELKLVNKVALKVQESIKRISSPEEGTGTYADLCHKEGRGAGGPGI